MSEPGSGDQARMGGLRLRSGGRDGVGGESVQRTASSIALCGTSTGSMGAGATTTAAGQRTLRSQGAFSFWPPGSGDDVRPASGEAPFIIGQSGGQGAQAAVLASVGPPANASSIAATNASKVGQWRRRRSFLQAKMISEARKGKPSRRCSVERAICATSRIQTANGNWRGGCHMRRRTRVSRDGA
jgi:hypothetical protein